MTYHFFKVQIVFVLHHHHSIYRNSFIFRYHIYLYQYLNVFFHFNIYYVFISHCVYKHSDPILWLLIPFDLVNKRPWIITPDNKPAKKNKNKDIGLLFYPYSLTLHIILLYLSLLRFAFYQHNLPTNILTSSFIYTHTPIYIYIYTHTHLYIYTHTHLRACIYIYKIFEYFSFNYLITQHHLSLIHLSI